MEGRCRYLVKRRVFWRCVQQLFTLECLTISISDANEITIARLWNYFQRHYILSTKQEINNIKRPLFKADFEYLLRAKFKQGKPAIP